MTTHRDYLRPKLSINEAQALIVVLQNGINFAGLADDVKEDQAAFAKEFVFRLAKMTAENLARKHMTELFGN